MEATWFQMYSFKGGAGRTVTTSNVAYLLAKELKKRVLLIDADVESAGTSVLFDLEEPIREGRALTLQDILRGYRMKQDKTREDIDVSAKLRQFHDDLWPRIGYLIETFDSAYLRVLPSRVILNMDEETRASSPVAQDRFRSLQYKLGSVSGGPEIVLYDSSSGLQETANLGFCHCRVLVLFFRWSRQFVHGTTRFINDYLLDPERQLDQPPMRKILLVPAAVPSVPSEGTFADEIAQRERLFRSEIQLINHKAAQHFHSSEDWIEICRPIRECVGLKWDDRILLRDRPSFLCTPDSENVLEDYHELARTIVGLAGKMSKEPSRIRLA